MINIVDVDWEKGFELELQFSDGLQGKVDLTSCLPLLNGNDWSEDEFCSFSLEEDGLQWENGVLLSHEPLHKLMVLQGNSVKYTSPNPSPKHDDFEGIIKQAAWDSVVSNRSDIFQAAVKGFVEKHGISEVQRLTSIKSRPSVYKSLDCNNSPKLSTLIELAHGVFTLQTQSASEVETAALTCHDIEPITQACVKFTKPDLRFIGTGPILALAQPDESQELNVLKGSLPEHFSDAELFTSGYETFGLNCSYAGFDPMQKDNDNHIGRGVNIPNRFDDNRPLFAYVSREQSLKHG